MHVVDDERPTDGMPPPVPVELRLHASTLPGADRKFSSVLVVQHVTVCGGEVAPEHLDAGWLPFPGVEQEVQRLPAGRGVRNHQWLGERLHRLGERRLDVGERYDPAAQIAARPSADSGSAHDAARQRHSMQIHPGESAAQVILRCLSRSDRLQSLPEQRGEFTVVHFRGAPAFESAQGGRPRHRAAEIHPFLRQPGSRIRVRCRAIGASSRSGSAASSTSSGSAAFAVRAEQPVVAPQVADPLGGLPPRSGALVVEEAGRRTTSSPAEGVVLKRCWQSLETDVFWTIIDVPHRRGLDRGYRSGCRGAGVGVCAAAG